jgi:hypothetical protein
VDHDGRVVDAVKVAQRGTDHQYRHQCHGRLHDALYCIFDGVQECVLHQDVIE